MKKTVKILFVFLLIFALSFSAVVTANASYDISANDKEIDFLRKIGVSEVVISRMPQERREYLYNRYVSQIDSLQFLGHKEEIVEMANPDSNTDIVPYGQIPTAQLQLNIDVLNGVDAKGYVVVTYVDVWYEWLQRPFFMRTDAHTFNFNSEQFYFSELYGYAYYKDKDGTLVFGDEVFGPATAGNGGIGWYLKTSNSYPYLFSDYGGASITLLPAVKFSPSSYHSNMYYQYAHQIGIISIGLSASGPSIIFSSGDYDSQTLVYRY